MGGAASTMSTMALAALIDDTKTRNDWTDPMIAERGSRDGYRLTKSDVSNYRRFGMRVIVPNKIKALAQGLGMPSYQVALAILADNGIVVPLEQTRPEVAIERDVTLTAASKRALLAILHGERDTGN